MKQTTGRPAGDTIEGNSMNDKICQMVADRIAAIIESEKQLTWVKNWKTQQQNTGAPFNGATGHRYEGLNLLVLTASPYLSPEWYTFKQVSDLGGKVLKGEKAWPVVFWKMLEVSQPKADGTTEKKNIPLLRYYLVFNRQQCQDLPASKFAAGTSAGPSPYKQHEPVELAESIVAGYVGNGGPTLQVIEQDRAYYSPAFDKVVMPLLHQFDAPENYYSTLFHEMGHSTGHANRLARKEVTTPNKFGSNPYGMEELVAELCAAFLCAQTGISNESQERNSAAYIKGWMRAIKADPSLFVVAAQRATKAAKLITKHTAAEVVEVPELEMQAA